MTKSELFKAAHKLAKATIQAGDNYSATFAICLKLIIKANAEAPSLFLNNTTDVVWHQKYFFLINMGILKSRGDLLKKAISRRFDSLQMKGIDWNKSEFNINVDSKGITVNGIFDDMTLTPAEFAELVKGA